MKFSILNRLQNSIARMVVPFIVYTFNDGFSDEIIKYYAIGAALSGVMIFGFPLKINRDLYSNIRSIKNNEIFFMYLLLVTIFVFYFLSKLWDLSSYIFIIVGLYFAFSNIHVSFEKYCQFHSKDKVAFVFYFIYNSLLLMTVFILSFYNANVKLFFISITIISLLLIVTMFFKFFEFISITVVDIKHFLENTIELGKYSLLQNIMSRGDSLILPYFFQNDLFAKYYIFTKFLDVGGFLTSMFSQLSLVQSYKKNKSPVFISYFVTGFIAMALSLLLFLAYLLYKEISISAYIYILFFIVLTKSIILYFQDYYIYVSKESYMNYALYIQVCTFLFLLIFIDFSANLLGVYFYMSYMVIVHIVSLIFLLKLKGSSYVDPKI